LNGYSWRVNDRIGSLRKVQEIVLRLIATLEKQEAERLRAGGLEFDKQAEEHRRGIASLIKEVEASARLEKRITRNARLRIRRAPASRANGADLATVLRFDPIRREK
jgi:hypothetical protein